MLQETIAVLYISWLCWSAGRCALSGFGCFFRERVAEVPFSITCMAGLAMFAMAGSILSLFMPLGGVWIQVFPGVGCLAYWLFNRGLRKTFPLQINSVLKAVTLPVLAMTLVMIALILVMSVYVIMHPDTLAYHAQIIKWIQEFRVVPGLAHMHVRYGLQNNWFVLCALFSFPFTHTHSFTFINTTVAIWFVVFIGGRIQRFLQAQAGHGKGDARQAILSLGLLIITFCDFGQLRLTAVSASPDFMAGLCIWLVLYLFMQNHACQCHALLAVVFSVFAVTIKLSCAPVLILSLYLGFRSLRSRQYRLLALSGLVSLCLILPFLIRNFITSGYPLFPSVFPDLLSANWKLDPETLRRVVTYVQDYGKIGARANLGRRAPASVLHLQEWLPVWWQLRSIAEKVEIALLLASLIAVFVRMKRLLLAGSAAQNWALLTSVAGVLFWFLQAPDPRFGYGFVIATPAIVFYSLASKRAFARPVARRLVLWGTVAFSLCTGCYTVYRLANFFAPRNLLSADGLFVCHYEKRTYLALPLYVPQKGCACGGTPLPCSDVTPVYLFRGRSLADGFKAGPQATQLKR